MTDASSSARPLAIVTGASSGIGLELASLFVRDGYDLVVASDEADKMPAAVQRFESEGASVTSVVTDLSTEDGVQELYRAVAGRPVDALAANAGHGLGHAFFDQDFEDALHVINTNVVGTVRLIYLVGRDMRARGAGKILITSSIASLMPGTFQAVYNASKAFIQSFSFALRNELKDSGVTVTALMPGVTDTNFFHRAGLDDTMVGQMDKKDDPADVARTGYKAMKDGDGDVIHGLHNKVQGAMAAITPDTALAEAHRKQAEPGSGKD